MKLVKLSLVAALAVGSFSVLEAKPLEEAIKNVDISGMMRYRYDSVNWKNPSTDINPNGLNAAGLAGSQRHHFRAFVTPKIDVGDGFKFVGQVMYNNDTNDGWGAWNYNTSTGAKTFESVGTVTKNSIVLKQAYLQYDLADAGVSFLLGKQALGTIWTNDFTGTAAKVLITPTSGLTIAAFAVDSFEGPSGDGDAANFKPYLGDAETRTDAAKNTATVDAAGDLNKRLYKHNMYGAAVLANFAGLNAQIWGNYWDKTAVLWAVNLNYKLALGGGNNVGVKVTYLGNALQSDFKDTKITSFTDEYNKTDLTKGDLGKVSDSAGNGNLVDGRLFANFAGLDAQVGGIFFGKKDKLTINTLEEVDTPAGLYIGREIFYTQGSWIVLSQGQNTFGYVGVGYTLPMDLRVGVQGVFGQNKYNDGSEDAKDEKSNRYEISADVSYKVNKNLSFLTYYSYLDINNKDGLYDEAANTTSDAKYKKHTVRLQALYKF